MDAYRDVQASERRKAGESFWWYICCSPKSPYPGEFIDRPGTELRVWLWQAFQRSIEGILIFEATYWTSSTAYPDPARPQNPYTQRPKEASMSICRRKGRVLKREPGHDGGVCTA